MIQKWVPITVNGLCTLSRGTVAFTLGYKLAEETIAPALGITDDVGKNAFAGCYGAVVAAPSSLLALTGSDGFLENLLTPKTKAQKKLFRSLSMAEKFFWSAKNIWFVPPLALISSSTFGYITYEELSPFLSYGVIPFLILNVYNRAVMDYLKTPVVIGKATNFFVTHCLRIQDPPFVTLWSPHDQERLDLLESLDKKCRAASNYFSGLTPENAQAFYHAWERSNDQEKLLKLLNPHLYGPPSSNPSQTTVSKSGPEKLHLKDISSFTSGVIGAIGVWLYLPATIPPFEAMFGDGEKSDEAAEAFAIMALISASSIFYYAAADTGAKLYDGIAALLRCHKEDWSFSHTASSALSAVFAAASASQAFEISQDFEGNQSPALKYTELATAFYSTFSLNFWGMRHAILKYVFREGPKKPQNKESLSSYLNRIMLMVPDLSNEALLELNTLMDEERHASF
ncbi:hypothetical protein EIL50_04660 [bacterium NHP-B]|nr:hypothetical protein EIL50_04660 [bacterium NHP-B]